MRVSTLVVLLFLLTVNLAYAQGYGVEGKAGRYTVRVTFEANAPHRGENVISVDVEDAALKPVSDVAVTVDYFMPSLPGRPPMMEYKATASREGNMYKTALDLSMAGEWTFVIHIIHEGSTDSMTFTRVVR